MGLSQSSCCFHSREDGAANFKRSQNGRTQNGMGMADHYLPMRNQNFSSQSSGHGFVDIGGGRGHPDDKGGGYPMQDHMLASKQNSSQMNYLQHMSEREPEGN